MESLSFDLPPDLMETVKDCYIPINFGEEDKLIWNLTPTGEFSTKSAYMLIEDQSVTTPDPSHPIGTQSPYTWIWKLPAPNIIKTFIWIFDHARLPTSHYLHSIGLSVDPVCSFCNIESETMDHIFFHCDRAKRFWSSISKASTSIPSLDSSTINLNNWKVTWNSVKTKPFNKWITWNHVIPFCLWVLWLNRNDNLFRGKKNHVNTSVVINLAMEYNTIITHDNPPQKPRIPIHITWIPPPNNHVKLNVDGTAKANPGTGGIGGIFRDNSGKWILGFTKACANITPLQAEMLAILHGLRIAVERNLSPLEINTDSAAAISMFINNALCFANLISECRSLMRKLGPAKLSHVFREANAVADALAKEGSNSTAYNNITLLEYAPDFVVSKVELDAQGFSYTRRVPFCNLTSTNDIAFKLLEFVLTPNVGPN